MCNLCSKYPNASINRLHLSMNATCPCGRHVCFPTREVHAEIVRKSGGKTAELIVNSGKPKPIFRKRFVSDYVDLTHMLGTTKISNIDVDVCEPKSVLI